MTEIPKYHSADWGFWRKNNTEYYCLQGIKGIPDDEIWFVGSDNFLNQEMTFFDWGFYKENKMKENTMIIREVERQFTGVIKHLENFAEVLKKLVPKVIEKKEIVLKNGQIYKNRINNEYYLLQKSRSGEWKLVWLKDPTESWAGWRLEKEDIEKHFTFCPNAEITVKEND